jgi:hypothetical protein
MPLKWAKMALKSSFLIAGTKIRTGQKESKLSVNC